MPTKNPRWAYVCEKTYSPIQEYTKHILSTMNGNVFFFNFVYIFSFRKLLYLSLINSSKWENYHKNYISSNITVVVYYKNSWNFLVYSWVHWWSVNGHHTKHLLLQTIYITALHKNAIIISLTLPAVQTRTHKHTHTYTLCIPFTADSPSYVHDLLLHIFGFLFA